jgi:hypothetical protein
MVYLAWTIWVLLLFGISLGTNRIWQGLARSRRFNYFVLPGILVHQLSVAFASVVTGATVTHISIRGESQHYLTHTRPKIPILGQALIGFAPLIGCSLVIWGLLELFGRPVDVRFTLPETIRITGPGLESFATSIIDILSATLAAIKRADFGDWKTYLFLYLSVTLGFTICPAREDLKTTIIGLVIVAVALLAIDLIGARIVGGPTLSRFQGGYWKILTYLLAIGLGFFCISLFILGFCKLFGLVPPSSKK